MSKSNTTGQHSAHTMMVVTRYIVLIPIIGLALAAAMLFIFGGIKLLTLIWETSLAFLGLGPAHASELPIYVEIVEYVHTFLIGTVLYLTAVGFFQLFIKKVDFPRWLRISNAEELETNLIGVTVVVLAINFMAISFNKNGDYLVRYGIAIAMPIAALGLFLGMRAWANKMNKQSEMEDEEYDAFKELVKQQLEQIQKEKAAGGESETEKKDQAIIKEHLVQHKKSS